MTGMGTGPDTGPTTLGRAARLDRVLADLLTEAPELEAAAVVTFDGLAMASLLPSGMEEDKVAAMSAALLTLGERASEGLGRGELAQVWIEGESGTVFLVSAEDEAVLVAVAAAGAKAGLMLYEVRRAAARVAEVLRAGDEPPLFEQLLDAAAARKALEEAQALDVKADLPPGGPVLLPPQTPPTASYRLTHEPPDLHSLR